MARPLNEQIDDINRQISITENYFDRLKKRLKNLIKRKEYLEYKLNPPPAPAVAEISPEVPAAPETEKDDFGEPTF